MITAACILSALAGILSGIVLMVIYTVRHPRKIPSLTKYVAFSLLMLTIYTVAEMIVSTRSGVSHDQLTTMVFSVLGGEVLSCALIKIFKLKEENNNADGRFDYDNS